MIGLLGVLAAAVVVTIVVIALCREWDRIDWWQDEQDAEKPIAPAAEGLTRFPPTPVDLCGLGTVQWHTHLTEAHHRQLAAHFAEQAERVKAQHTAHLDGGTA